jgi:hypothetical protein
MTNDYPKIHINIILSTTTKSRSSFFPATFDTTILYVFMVYITTLSISQTIYCRMLWWLVSNEFGRISEEGMTVKSR